MSGKKSRKRIVPQNEDLIRMDLEGLNSATVYDNDDDGDDDFKPSKTLKHDDDNDQDIGDENSDDDESEETVICFLVYLFTMEHYTQVNY